jgi:hypothetical protein
MSPVIRRLKQPLWMPIRGVWTMICRTCKKTGERNTFSNALWQAHHHTAETGHETGVEKLGVQ